MDLKTLLGDNYSEEVAAKLKGVDIFEKGKAMPIEKFNSKMEEVNAQKNELKEQVDTLNSTLSENSKDFEKFKKAAEGNEELQKQLQDYQDKFNSTQSEFSKTLEDKETEWKQREINNLKKHKTIEKLLQEHADPTYMEEFEFHINKNADKITMNDDGSFNGVDDVVKNLKTSKPGLFASVQVIGTGVDSTTTNPINNTANLNELAKKAQASGSMADRIAYAKAKESQNKE